MPSGPSFANCTIGKCCNAERLIYFHLTYFAMLHCARRMYITFHCAYDRSTHISCPIASTRLFFAIFQFPQLSPILAVPDSKRLCIISVPQNLFPPVIDKKSESRTACLGCRFAYANTTNTRFLTSTKKLRPHTGIPFR